MRLYAIRHPQPMGAEGLCYGQSDLAISPDDLRATAAKLQGLLVDKPIDCWLSSPLQRCEQLARTLTDDFRCDDRLLEMHFGEWESLSWDDIDRQAFDDWMVDYVNQAPPGGESFGAVQRRVTELLAELKASGLTGEAGVALVTHGGVIRSLLAELLEIPVESTWHFSVGYGSLLEFEVGELAYQNRLLGML